MALISCPECKKEISDKAKVCVHCGYPVQEGLKSGIVRIKIPIQLFSASKVIITDCAGQILWEGKHGQNAKFTIDEPTQIFIDLGTRDHIIESKVEPNCRYILIQEMGMRLRATFILSEVDVIDS